MAERLYVSNKNETVRMFESDFMEFFSRVHPVTPLVIYLPVVGYMLYVSLWQRRLLLLGGGGVVFFGGFVLAVLGDLIYPYIFPYGPRTCLGKHVYFFIYG